MAYENTEIISLSDSQVCRLCGESNLNGNNLYDNYGNESEIVQLINHYLPLKIKNDGIYPRWICPGCQLQVESTAQFFELVLLGQERLKNVLIINIEEEKPQSLLKPEILTDNIIYNNNDSLTGEYLFSNDVNKIDGVEIKPKKKRGRPPKPPQDVMEMEKIDDHINNEPVIDETETFTEDESNKRSKRKVKLPFRYKEAVQGKELERMYVEKGVIDKMELGSDLDDNLIEENFGCDSENRNEVIGHLQTLDGTNMGDLVFVKTKYGKNNLKKGQMKFMCDICNKEFIHEYKFVRHRSSHHNVRYECTQCLSQFLTRQQLSEHQLSIGHIGEGIIESLHEEITPENKIIKNPVEDVIKNDSLDTQSDFITYEETTIDKENLNVKTEKYVNNDKKIIKCDVCDRIFNHYGSLIYHKESQHNKNRKFLCSKCDKSFTHRLLLQRHQRTHSTERPFACTLCSARFKRKSNLKYHRFKHNGIKNYKCDVCQQQFSHKNSLDNHYRLHSGEKPFKCTMCPKSFTQSGNLKEHIRIHTGEKPFKCTYCPKVFTTSSQCKNHIKQHVGDRPYCCEICNKKFLYIEIYKTHMRRHNGEKPFFCMVCPKAFADNWSLRKHSRYHTGEKPYPCNYCGKFFADCSNLKKHKMNNCIPKHTNMNNQKDDSNKKENQEIPRLIEENSDIISTLQTNEILSNVEMKDNEGETEQIIYLTYQENDETVGNGLNGLQVITSNLNTNSQYIHEYQTTPIHTTNSPMLISLADTKGVLTTTQNILHVPEEENDLLYRLQPTTSEGNLIPSEQTVDPQIEYITEDGTKLQFLTYANPIEIKHI